MFGGLNRPVAAVLAAVAVFAAVLAAPSAALACGGGVSAVNVYSECQPSGSGGKSTGSGGSNSTSGGSTSTSGGSTGSTSAPISQQTKKSLKKAGQDEQPLTNLVKGVGAARLLQSTGSAAEPTAVGSAFDLGSGPTALLIVLAGTAILLLAATGFRGVRQRRR